jgi:sec-independent protein translocase protein TatA
MPFNIHPIFLIVLLAVVLIIFGPGKLPELGGAVGRSIKEFRKASNELTDEVRTAIENRGRDETYPASEAHKTEAPKAEAPVAEAPKAAPAEKPDAAAEKK